MTFESYVVLLKENEAPFPVILLLGECLPLKLEYALSNCLYLSAIISLFLFSKSNLAI